MFSVLTYLFLDEAKLAEVNREIEILKFQTEKDMDDKEKLKRQVLEKNKECKTLNNRLQEAKVKNLIYPKRLFYKSYKKQRLIFKFIQTETLSMIYADLPYKKYKCT